MPSANTTTTPLHSSTLCSQHHHTHTQVVEKELLIQEKEKLYMEMKQVLQRQPGPEVAEQLQIYQQSLKEKTKQMKVWKGRGRRCNFHIYVVVFVLQNGIVVSLPPYRAWHQS